MTSACGYDVVIVGGAAHGASLAYHLASSDFGGSILLIEKDPTFASAATALSAGGIRQQFSTPVNIEISLYGIAFLRTIGDRLAVDGIRPDVGLREGGYLFLASPAGADTLRANHAVQTSLGADIAYLDESALRSRFSYLNCSGIVAGCLGVTGEGWFDGYGLAQALRRKAAALGVTQVAKEVVSVEVGAGKATGVRLRDGTAVAAGCVAIAAGTAAPDLLAPLGLSLPVEARKRYVFSFACHDPLRDLPLVIDPAGIYVRPEGESYICGASPPPDRDGKATDFDVDHGVFEDEIWPVLAHRIPAFERIRPGLAWAGHYDFNWFDQNAIVGRLPGLENLLIATGFSGHGLQQAPGVGRGLAELIAHGRYTTIDLSPLGYDRIGAGHPLVEINVV